MRLVRALLVIFCISRASAQTCAVGQVLVNSVCTYNDPALAIWYKFDLNNTQTNFGKVGNYPNLVFRDGESLWCNIANNNEVCVTPSPVAKIGNGSIVTNLRSNEQWNRPTFHIDVKMNYGSPKIFTISMWSYVTEIVQYTNTNNYGLCFIDYEIVYLAYLKLCMEPAPPGTGWFKYILSTFNPPSYTAVTSTERFYYMPGGITQNKWYHFALTVNNQEFKFYVDGTLVKSTSVSYTTSSETYSSMQKITATWPAWKPPNYIDDFRIYNRALTSNEIRWLYQPCTIDVPFYFDTYVCPCGPGYVSVSGVCAACAAGKFAVAEATVCTNCLAGTYSNVTAASSSVVCTNCAAGAYSLGGVSACTNCSAGTYSNLTGASSVGACVPCPAGAYSSVAGATNASTCVSCPAGKYSMTAGASTCTTCPASSSTFAAGSTSITNCSCNAGFYGPNGGPCTACALPRNVSIPGTLSVSGCGCAANNYYLSENTCVDQSGNNVINPTGSIWWGCDVFKSGLSFPGGYCVMYSVCSKCPYTCDDQCGLNCIQSSCLTCPPNSMSPMLSTSIKNCSCNSGFAGENGRTCSKCTSNSISLRVSESVSECKCDKGYYSFCPVNSCEVSAYSSTACTRMTALITYKTSFSRLSQRLSIGVGSNPMPTYNPTGGPNRQGHVTFDPNKFQYLDAGTRTLNIATNGGLTIVAVIRSNRDLGVGERIVDFGSIFSSFTKSNNIQIFIEPSSTSISYFMYDSSGNYIWSCSVSQVVVKNKWLTIVARYSNTLDKELKVDNKAVSCTPSRTIQDRTVTYSLIGKATYDPSVAYFYGDVAGVFVVDEYLSASACTEIVKKMIDGVDLTAPVCNCTACDAGKYKDVIENSQCTNCPVGMSSTVGASSQSLCQTVTCTPGQYLSGIVCVNCPAGTYSNATGANSSNTCVPCPAGAFSGVTGASSANTCVQCPAGAYSAVTGASTCVLCPAGSSSSVVGSTSISNCLCAAGTYIPGVGATACITCGVNNCFCENFAMYDVVIENVQRKCGINENQACEISPASGAGDYCSASVMIDGDENTGCEIRSPNAPAYVRINLGVPRKISAIKSAIFSAFYGNYDMAVEVGNTDAISTSTTFPNKFCTWIQRSTQVNVQKYCTSECSALSYSSGGSGPYDACLGTTGTPTIIEGQYIFLRPVDKNNRWWDPSGWNRWALVLNEIYITVLKPSCMTCPVNTASPWSNISKTTGCQCNIGYTGPDGGTCTACVAGKFKNNIGNVNCTNCAEGTYASVAGATKSSICNACLPNSNSPAGSTSASACSCNVGYYSVNGSACLNCAAGKLAMAGGSVCACPSGYAATSDGNCEMCEAGKFKGLVADTNCTSCAAGTYMAGVGATACLACAAYADADVPRVECRCNAGATGNGSVCVRCVAGKYKSVTGNESCVDCGANTYSTTVGATGAGACVGCPVNAVSGAGSAVIGSCVCNVGSTGPNGGTCTLCAVGKYKSVNGTLACTDCLAGSYSGTLGANSSARCLSCPDNSSSVAGSSAVTACICSTGASGPNGGPCALCVPGKYKAVTGTSVCLNCSANTFSTVTGATSISACSTCPDNSQSFGASAVCVCNRGYTGPDGGPCLACVPGTFKTQIGAADCTFCPNNTFSGVVGSTNASVCQACQANAISAAGSVDQEYCYCKPGYAHLEGRHACRECTPGTYNSQLGRRACSNCTIGMYSLNYSAISPETCKFCPEGQWSPEGSANCNLCPVHSHTLNVSGLITDCVCDAGFIGPGGSTCVV